MNVRMYDVQQPIQLVCSSFLILCASSRSLSYFTFGDKYAHRSSQLSVLLSNHGIDLSMELAHFIIQIALIIVMFIGDPTKDRADDWFHAGTNEFVNAVLIVFLVFNFVAIFLIGQLLWFHSGLQRENLTTYKYIVRDHQRKRDKMRLEGEIMQLRHTEMAKARQQGKCLQSLAWRWEINVDKLAAFLVIP
jgi:hypothetical protein